MVTTVEQRTNLMNSAIAGNLSDVMKYFLLEVKKVDRYGKSALIYAVEYGNHACVELLVSEARIVDSSGFTALMYAIAYNRIPSIKLLAPLEADIYDKNQLTPLMHAINKGNSEHVRIMLPHYFPHNDCHGKTALMYAVLRGLSEFIEPLKGEVSCKDDYGFTALHYAICKNDAKTLEYLYRLHESKRTIIDKFKLFTNDHIAGNKTSTLLMIAAEKGYPECVKVLKDTMGKQNSLGMTALMYAAKNGHATCVRLLLHEREKRDWSGRTALIYAAIFGHLECVKLLIAESYIRDVYGISAALYAEKGWMNKLVKIFSTVEPLNGKQLIKQTDIREYMRIRKTLKYT